MKVYIIGHANLDDIPGTSKKFVNAQMQLMRDGHDATSIIKCSNLQWTNDKSTEAKERLKLVANSDAVFVLNDWENDPIARHEVTLAVTLGKRVVISRDTILPQRITFYTNVPEYTF